MTTNNEKINHYDEGGEHFLGTWQEPVKAKAYGTNKPIWKDNENFDFFEQQKIIHGGSTPAEIIEQREKEDKTADTSITPLDEKIFRLAKKRLEKEIEETDKKIRETALKNAKIWYEEGFNDANKIFKTSLKNFCEELKELGLHQRKAISVVKLNEAKLKYFGEGLI